MNIECAADRSRAFAFPCRQQSFTSDDLLIVSAKQYFAIALGETVLIVLHVQLRVSVSGAPQGCSQQCAKVLLSLVL